MTLSELARRVEKLRPSHRDPENFFIERDEIAHAIRQIARNGPPRFTFRVPLHRARGFNPFGPFVQTQSLHRGTNRAGSIIQMQRRSPLSAGERILI